MRKGTFKVSKPRIKQGLGNIVDFDRSESGAGQDKKLRDMSINIK